MAKAQIALEFLIAVAVYLSFLSILIYTQQGIIQDLKKNAETTRNYLNVESANFIFSLEKIFASSKIGPVNYKAYTSCRIIGNFVYCGQDNPSKENLSTSENYANTLA